MPPRAERPSHSVATRCRRADRRWVRASRASASASTHSRAMLGRCAGLSDTSERRGGLLPAARVPTTHPVHGVWCVVCTRASVETHVRTTRALRCVVHVRCRGREVPIMAYAVVCGLLFSAFGPPAPAGRQVVPSFIYRGRSLDLETFWLGWTWSNFGQSRGWLGLSQYSNIFPRSAPGERRGGLMAANAHIVASDYHRQLGASSRQKILYAKGGAGRGGRTCSIFELRGANHIVWARTWPIFSRPVT